MNRKLILTTLFLTIVFVSIGETDTVICNQPIIQIDNHIPNSKSSNPLINVFEKLIPLFGVILGFLLVVIKENFANRHVIQSNGQGWTECFIQIEDSLINQLNEIKEFLENNPENTYELTDFSLIEALNGAEFEEYDQKYLTSYLKRKNKLKQKDAIKLAGKLKAIVRVIKSNKQKLTSFFSLLTENTAPHFQEFKTSFAAYRKIIAEYIDEINNSDSTPDQKAISYKIIELSNSEIQPSIINNEPLNAFKFSENFIKPFFELAYDDRFHPKMKLAVELLSQCDHSIMAIKMERRYLRIKLEKLKSSLEKNLILVTEMNDKI